jgi:aryl-alcohol dehydrogenase-like predicted oxidoreductase
MVEKLQTISTIHGHTLLELAIGWLIDKPIVSSVIAGATKPSQIENNAKAAAYRPSVEEKSQIDEITLPAASGNAWG